MIEVKPRFRPDIISHRFDEKGGGRSLVLEDRVANKFFRISFYEFELLKILDGTLSIKEAVERLKLHGRYFTLEYATRLVDQCARSGLLLGTQYGTSTFQLDLHQRMKTAKEQGRLGRLYFLFIPLINPDRFLEKTLWLWHLVVNRFTGMLFALLVPGALYLVISGLSRIRNEFLYFFNLENLLVLWIALVGLKLVHEFSHAYTAKNLGLHVPEMGIAFLVFFPCLYCNTTAAWELADRRQRMSIGAAGVLSELVTAVIATYVWYFTKPGVLNSVAFFLMAVSWISSLLFNGNPLMKFDGYLVLTDWLRVPNLQLRSFAQIRYLFYNRVLGIESVQVAKSSGRERAIFTTYGICAFVYRVFLYTGIVAGVYYRFDKTTGMALGFLALSLFVVKPVTRGTVGLVKKRSEMHLRPYGLLAFAAILGMLIFLITRPWSENSVYPCYVESGRVRHIAVPVEAPVSEVLVREGDTVREGQTLFRLDPTLLKFGLADKKLERSLLQEEIAMIESTGKELSMLPLKYIDLGQLNDAMWRIEQDLEQLDYKAPFSGYLVKLARDLKPGAQPGRGTVVGQLASPELIEVLGIIPEVDVMRIRQGAKVAAWFSIGTGRHFALKIREVSPFSRKDLDSSPFSSRFGGEIATQALDQNRKDAPIETHYVCKADLPRDPEVELGMTGRLVVHHPPKSILERIIEKTYRTFRREIVF